MRPVSIRFQCFGPYMEEQFIEFEALMKNGLFLICGETGAGKTTILDAMCYALYGKSSGGRKGDRGDLSVMRCSQAKKEDETRVEFVFDTGGKRYQFVRSLKYSRKNLHDYHNCMVWEEGRYVPLFANPKKQNVNQKARELLGLTDQQFRQVVVLPQGQFERFLVSDSAEKETILVSLFKADRWQRIVDEIFRRATEEDQRLQSEFAWIRSRLADYACESVKELREAVSGKTEELRRLKKLAEAAEHAEHAEEQRYQKAEKLYEEFAHMAEAAAGLDLLKLQEENRKKEEAFLGLTDKAEEIRPLYLAYLEAVRQEKELRKESEAAARKLEEAADALERAKSRMECHEEKRPQQEENLRRSTLLDDLQELYGLMESKKKEMVRLEKIRKEKKDGALAAERAYERADEKWLLAMDMQRRKIQEYTDAQSQYLRGISGALAEKLTAGEPCPVCGSREHPHPASAKGQKVTERDLEACSDAMEQANRQVEHAGKARREAESICQKRRQEAEEAEQNVIALQSAYEEMEKRRLPGIATIAQLRKELDDRRAAIKSYREEEARVQTELSRAKGEEQAARVQRKLAEEKEQKAGILLKEQQKVWERTYRESGFAAEEDFTDKLLEVKERNRRKEALIQFRTDYKNAACEVEKWERHLEGKEKPQLDALKLRLKEAQEERKKADKKWILGQQEQEQMQKDLHALEKRKETYDRQRGKADENLEFASRLRGRSGISLQRYVLGVMLSSITVEANRLLEHVHGGRYQLYRTNEIAGSSHKGGLELEVLDRRSNERRSVTTLSGGEKFLVALGLAIGLSTVVQAQGSGMKLEAMFVDEGFGTLDQNSILDALEVLQGIQRANGLVGIISHVEMLKDVIGSRIEVVKEETGSRCVIR